MKVSDITIKVGDYITVTEWKTFLNDKDGNPTKRKDQSYIGDCMMVLAIDKNLLRVEAVSKYKHNREPFTLNMDKVATRRLSPEYVIEVLKELL